MWKVVQIFSGLSVLLLIAVFVGAKSSVQEAAGAALALAVAVIPYVFARALQEDRMSDSNSK